MTINRLEKQSVLNLLDSLRPTSACRHTLRKTLLVAEIPRGLKIESEWYPELNGRYRSRGIGDKP